MITHNSKRTVRQNGELQRHGNMTSVEQRFAEIYFVEWMKEFKMVVDLRYVYTLCFRFSKTAEILNHCSVYSLLFDFNARGTVGVHLGILICGQVWYWRPSWI